MTSNWLCKHHGELIGVGRMVGLVNVIVGLVNVMVGLVNVIVGLVNVMV